MDQNTMILLGVVKLQNPITKHTEVFEVKGFDFVGFFFPFLRYAIAGMWGKAALTFLASCTLIGYPIVAWITGFNFRKYRLEHMVRSGWVIVNENPKATAA